MCAVCSVLRTCGRGPSVSLQLLLSAAMGTLCLMVPPEFSLRLGLYASTPWSGCDEASTRASVFAGSESGWIWLA